jgi:hypothetical protein
MAKARRPWLLIPSLPTVPREGNFGRVELRRTDGVTRAADLYPVLNGMSAKLSRDGESTLTLSLSDPDHELLTAGRLDPILDPRGSERLASVDLRAVGVWWRVTALRRQDAVLTIEAEDRAIAFMRQHDRRIAVSRGSTTRAGFIRRMIEEVKAGGGIRYFIPELGVRQPIAKGETAAERRASATAAKTAGARGADGFGAKGDQVTVKGRRATAKQLRVIHESLTECAAQKCSRRVMIADVMCLTQESVAGADVRKTGNDDVGDFQQGRNWISARNVGDVAKETRAFLLGHEAKVGGTGPVQGWKQRHGSLRNAGGNLDAMIRAVQISIGGYAPWEREATKTVDLWLARNGGDAGAATTETTSRRQAYMFRRGDPGGERENSWIAGQRLADEVRFSLFAVANTITYASDRELAAARPVAELERTDDAVVSLSWDQDTRAPVDDLTATVAWDDDPWALVPGMSIAVSGEGPADGRYVIDDATIDFLSHSTDLTLVRPGVSKREPAPEIKTTTTTTGGSSGASGSASSGTTGARALYEWGLKNSGKWPYSWGGGHPSGGTPSRGTNRSDGGPIVTGYDCSGASGAAAIAADWGYKRGQAIPSSGTMARSWGRPGRGKYVTMWANDNHVFFEFHGMGKYRRLDTQSGRSHRSLGGVYMETNMVSTAGYTARHWPGS